MLLVVYVQIIAQPVADIGFYIVSLVGKVVLNEIGCYTLLDAERERELGRKSRGGDLSARNELVEHNLKLVVSIAARYRGNGLDMDDLIQSGNLGLMVAAQRYDPDLGYRFTTFAVHWICQYIRREISNTGRVIRIPVHIVEKIHTLKKAERELEQALGRAPTMGEISDMLHAAIMETLR